MGTEVVIVPPTTSPALIKRLRESGYIVEIMENMPKPLGTRASLIITDELTPEDTTKHRKPWYLKGRW